MVEILLLFKLTLFGFQYYKEYQIKTRTSFTART